MSEKQGSINRESVEREMARLLEEARLDAIRSAEKTARAARMAQLIAEYDRLLAELSAISESIVEPPSTPSLRSAVEQHTPGSGNDKTIEWLAKNYCSHSKSPYFKVSYTSGQPSLPGTSRMRSGRSACNSRTAPSSETFSI